MKDKALRRKADDLEMAIARLREKHNLLVKLVGDVSIKCCPKCKHDVMAKKRNWDMIEDSSQWHDGRYIHRIGDSHYLCLTCGSKFTCSDECVCKLIEEELKCQ